MVITMAKLRMAHANTHGTRKPPGPTFKYKLLIMVLTVEYDSLTRIFGLA